jgi:hypothetical protein
MSNIPTAEEFLQDSFTISHFYNDKYNRMSCFSDDVQEAMIEFAKLHVEAALKAASQNAEIDDFYVFGTSEDETRINEYDLNGLKGKISKNSILNAYPLTNIK